MFAGGKWLFLWDDKGVVTCINAAEGKQHWKQRTSGPVSGSPIRVGEAIYCIDEAGVAYVLAASKEYKLISKQPLGEFSRSTPAVAGGRMYLRTYSHLISLGG
jgi:outer membrane protein assembly factor BamB